MQNKVYSEYFRCFRCLCIKQFYLKCRFNRDSEIGTRIAAAWPVTFYRESATGMPKM